MNNDDRKARQRDKDERYLVFDEKKGHIVFDSKRAWYDAVAKCSKNQIKEVNRSLKVLGINQTMMKADVNKVISIYEEKRLMPEYGPEIWTISGMLSGVPPTSEDIRNQISMVRKRRFQERLIERTQEAPSE